MYTHLSLANRITIRVLLRQKHSLRQIAAALGKSVSTVSRELRRARLRTYDPEVAHRRAVMRRRKASRMPRKLSPGVLREFATLLRRHRSVSSCACFLPVGKSAHYHWLWKDACRDSHMKPARPRNRRMRCAPHRHMSFGVGHYRKRPKDKRFAMMKDATPISERPAIVAARGRFGDWETDTMLWKDQISLSLRERKSGYVRLMLLPQRTADAVAAGIRKLLRGLPVRTITSDGGWEFVRARLVEKHLGAKWYVCDPGCPQQRGGVEQMHGLVRRMIRRDLHRHGLRNALRRAEHIINHRPTPRLQNDTPARRLGLC